MYKTLFTNEDLPDPDTPVIHVRRPIGIFTFTPSRLFAFAFDIEIHFLLGFNRLLGISIIFLPAIKSDV